MTARLPDLRPARVTIIMKDGSRFDAAVETNRGDWQDPYSADQLAEKYMSLAGRLWPTAYCIDVKTQIQNAEHLTVFMKLFENPEVDAMNLPASPAPGRGHVP